MSPLLIDRLRRRRRWLLPAALLCLAPKCLLCVAGYVGASAAILGGPEFCGAGIGSAGLLLAGTLVLLLGGGFVMRRMCRRHWNERGPSGDS